MRLLPRQFTHLIAIVALALSVISRHGLAEADDRTDFFEKKVRPVLVKYCYECHSRHAKEAKGELRLDLKAGWQRGGQSGEPAIVPGKPDESPLIRAIRHDGDVSAMPPQQPKLPQSVVADLTAWVRMGAHDPRDGKLEPRDQSAVWENQLRQRRDWWSLQPPKAVVPPKVPGNPWSETPVDRFILRSLNQHQLHPAPDADALTLLRRLSFVLTGLPPDPQDVKTFPTRFAKDPETAVAAFVDKRLQSPHYGERMARHWMDVVRYTDTYGYEWDNPAKGSWEYRDYLIRAFNRDVGFDQLIREQIAGDLLETPRIDSANGINESLIGPMFYHMGEHRHGDNVIINGVREEMIDNKIDAFSKAFLAMTVACARCHDHKFDAVSQRDYYALAGVFMTPRWTSRSIEVPEKNQTAIKELKHFRDQIKRRIGVIWKAEEKMLASGTPLQKWAAANSETLADAQFGEAEWLLKNLLMATDQDAAETWQRLAREWRKAHKERHQANAAKFTVLQDFSQAGFPKDWVTDGDGMQTGYVAHGEPLVSLEGDTIVERWLPRGYHTQALSSKLPGALRLPPQEVLPGKIVSVRLAGGEWSGSLRTPDNAFQTETIQFFHQNQPDWQAFADIEPNNGIQRVAYEIATSDLNPNFPPRTGLAKSGGGKLPDHDDGFGKRSWFSITGIVSHDQPGQPADELERFAPLFTGTAPSNTQAAWQRVGGWFAHAVNQCGRDDAQDDDVRLVNWLLDRRLLPNSLSDDADLATLVRRYRQVENSLAFPRTVNSMDERGVNPLDYALNIRGDINARGERVPRDFLSVFSRWHQVGDSANSGRLELANFLTNPRQGLTARVYVNRVWQWIFGQGLVRTPNDFGHLGEKPSHPELLDYLTREFIADGWSTKRLIRRLVVSRTFRQSGHVTSKAATIDPANRWWQHYPTRRLEAEAIRDALLAASGRLDRTLYGRPINPRRRVEDPAKRLFSGPLDGNGRRSIYLEVSIMAPSKFLQSFNAPDPKLPTGRRDETQVPTQALVMLNDPFVRAMAEHWAHRLVQDGATSVDVRIRNMFLQALGRPPTDEETRRWTAFVQELSTSNETLLTNPIVWKQTAHTLFNLQEFIYYE